MRLSELATLRYDLVHLDVNDVGMDQGLLRVLGKGRRPRIVHVGAKGMKALDRYLRARARHPHASSTALWIARKGPMTSSGVAQAVKGRAARLAREGRAADRSVGTGSLDADRLRRAIENPCIRREDVVRFPRTIQGCQPWRSVKDLSHERTSHAYGILLVRLRPPDG